MRQVAERALWWLLPPTLVLAAAAPTRAAGLASVTPTPTPAHDSTDYSHYVRDFKAVVVIAAIVLLLSLIGLVVSRDRRRGRHQ